MKIFYWSPFLSNIATVDSVTNSINSLKRYSLKNKYKTFIIDSTGEWQEKLAKISGIDIIKLYRKNYYKFLPKGNFFKSRLSQIFIFVLNFRRFKLDFRIVILLILLSFKTTSIFLDKS